MDKLSYGGDGIYTATVSPGWWKIHCNGGGGGGGQGDDSNWSYGYNGASAEAEFNFPSATTLKFVVGSAGLGKCDNHGLRDDRSGSGGGMSGVVYNDDLLIVAGGGGGGNWDHKDSNSPKFWDSSHNDERTNCGVDWNDTSRGLLASGPCESYTGECCAPSGNYGGGGTYCRGGGGGGYHGGGSYQDSYLMGGQTGTCGHGNLFSISNYTESIDGGRGHSTEKYGNGTCGDIIFTPLSVGVPPKVAPQVNVDLIHVNKEIPISWSAVPKVSVPNETTGGVTYDFRFDAIKPDGTTEHILNDWYSSTSRTVTLPDKYLNPEDNYHFKVHVAGVVKSETGSHNQSFYGPSTDIDDIKYVGKNINTIVLKALPTSIDPNTSSSLELSWSCEAHGAKEMHYELQVYSELTQQWESLSESYTENHFTIYVTRFSNSIACDCKFRVRAVIPDIKTGDWYETNTIKILPLKQIPQVENIKLGKEYIHGELCEVSWDKIEFMSSDVKYLIKLVWSSGSINYHSEHSATTDTTFKTYIPKYLITSNARFVITPFVVYNNTIFKYGPPTESDTFSTAHRPVIEVVNTEKEIGDTLQFKIKDPEGIDFIKELKISLCGRTVYVQTENFTEDVISYQVDKHLLKRGGNSLKISVTNNIDRVTTLEKTVSVSCYSPYTVNEANLKLEAFMSFVGEDEPEQYIKATKKIVGTDYASAESLFIGKGVANQNVNMKLEMTRDTIPEKKYGSERYGIDSLKGAIQ